MKYIVIGLNNLGRAIAENLTSIGNEVIGVDKDPAIIESIKQNVAGAICLDTTDQEALGMLPLTDVDAVIVTYGKDFGISIKTVALLKNMHVEKLIVRSISPIHEAVIKAIGVTDIITPETDYANTYASHALLGDLFKQWYKVTDEYHLFKMSVPQSLINQTIESIKFQEVFELKLVAIEHKEVKKNILGLTQDEYTVVTNYATDYSFVESDILLLFGKMESLRKLMKV